jgi:hypothetical protein
MDTENMPRNSNKLGVLVLGFNRPVVLGRTLQSLKDFAKPGDIDFFLGLDGPRDGADKIQVRACKNLFDEFAKWTNSSAKFYSQRNQGLRKNVLSSITRAFESKEIDNLLVLEDDCVFGESSLSFFEWGFKAMSQQNDIGVVSGSYFGQHQEALAFTASRFSSWGWGTNRSVWQKFIDNDLSKVNISSLGEDIRSLTRNTPLPYQYEYGRIIQNLNKLDSWAIPFDMFLRSENLLALKPTVNQIQNIGFGDKATHTGRGSSLSIEAGPLDVSKLQLADPDESVRIERAEAWSKFGKLAKELIFRR